MANSIYFLCLYSSISGQFIVVVPAVFITDGSNRIICNETSMAIYLDNRTQIYNGSSITLNDTSCTAKLYPPNNEYGLITAYDKCGTTRRETLTHIVYENEVTWIFGNASSAVVRATGKKLKFSCSLERSKNTSTTNLEPVKTFITATEGNILFLYTQSKNVQVNKTYILGRYHRPNRLWFVTSISSHVAILL